MPLIFTTSYLEDVVSLFRMYQRLSEKAMAQATDEQLLMQIDPEANSIALIVKHVAGNLRSRWTDFLTSDGEKPDRDRDGEFLNPPQTREELMKMWNEGWACLNAACAQLKEEDLARTVYIRGEAHSVVQALNRAVTHCAYHCGQIVMLAKHFQGEQWKSISVPKGKSKEFAERVSRGEASQR
jgi:uncharacterized damage-inducible protein DinB